MTQTVKDYIRSEQRQLLEEAKSIIDRAETEARSLAPEEREKIEQLHGDADKLDKKASDLEENERLRRQVDVALGPINKPAEQANFEAKTIGEAFIRSERYLALKDAGIFGGSNWTSGKVDTDFTPFGTKATLTSSTSAVVQPDVQPGIIEIRTQRPTVADLLNQVATTSNSVRVIQQITNTNAAAAVAEGTDKPEGTIDLDEVDEPVRKLAEVMTITDEMLEDVPVLRNFIDTQLRRHLALTEEAQILNGTGVAPNLLGILRRNGVLTQAVGSLSAADALYAALTDIRVNFFEPTGIVVHPNNWAAIRTEKDQNDQYYGGGPFVGPYGAGGIARDFIWGLPVIVTTSMPNDWALIGDFASATLYRRTGVSVEASNSHSDYFKKNLTMLRIEERVALGVPDPSAFCIVQGLSEIAS